MNFTMARCSSMTPNMSSSRELRSKVLGWLIQSWASAVRKMSTAMKTFSDRLRAQVRIDQRGQPGDEAERK